MANPIDDQLREEFEECRKKVVLLESELNKVQALMHAYQQVLAHRAGKDQYASGTGLHATIRPSQIAHCKTQREAWVEIARLSGGFAKPTDGAQLLIDVDLSDKNFRTVANNGSSWMGDSDRWEWTAPGLFRLLEDVPDATPSDYDEGEGAWPEKSLPTGDGDASPYAYPANGETVAAVGRIIA